MAKISELLGQMNERLIRLEETSQKTLVQTTKTNGRLSNLEDSVYGDGEDNPGLQKMVFGLIRWRSKLGGIWYAILIGSTAASAIGGLAFGIMTFLK